MLQERQPLEFTQTNVVNLGRQGKLPNAAERASWHHTVQIQYSETTFTVSWQRVRCAKTSLYENVCVSWTSWPQDLLFGDKKLKLSTKEEITVPNVVRTVIPERIIQQYNMFYSESGFTPVARSTLYAILNGDSASVRISLHGLDYVTVQTT